MDPIPGVEHEPDSGGCIPDGGSSLSGRIEGENHDGNEIERSVVYPVR